MIVCGRNYRGKDGRKAHMGVAWGESYQESDWSRKNVAHTVTCCIAAENREYNRERGHDGCESVRSREGKDGGICFVAVDSRGLGT